MNPTRTSPAMPFPFTPQRHAHIACLLSWLVVGVVALAAPATSSGVEVYKTCDSTSTAAVSPADTLSTVGTDDSARALGTARILSTAR